MTIKQPFILVYTACAQ